MQDCYFTPQEREQMLTTLWALLRALGDQVTWDDVRAVHGIVERGVQQGQYRRDHYGINPTLRHLCTALTLCQGVAPDRNMVIATMLYDLCRGEFLTVGDVTRQFGDDVATLVQGLLHVSQLYRKQAAVEDENFHKLLLALAQDIRVILIMIADRLALMRAINHHPDDKFVREVSTEARYLYAPLAHRLGLYVMKSELEDLSLKYLNRKVYDQIAKRLSATKSARDQYIRDFIKPINEALTQAGLHYEIKGRTKSINSIWNKMKNKGVDLSGIYDLFAVRIILDTPPQDEKKECWLAYSIVTDIYTANPSRHKDWITIPKSNGYESLHITVQGPQNRWVEVQIRTQRMDAIAERGLAAHWKYKGITSEGDMDTWMNNVREVLEAGNHDGKMGNLIRDMKRNPYDNEVFVFTPRGDLFKLPQGATLLDFAFHVHTRVGCTCVGGKVDGKNQRLNYRLKNGDTVEVLTSSAQSPKLDWLNHVVTNRARNKIKQAVNESRVRQAELARETLQRRFKNRKVDVDEATMARLVKRMGYKSSTDFLVAVHEGSVEVNTVVERYEQLVAQASEAITHGTAQDFVLQSNTHDEAQGGDDILVIGNDIKGINYKLSRCCNPIYGDRIQGFIASDGAIKVHRADCGNLKHLREKYPYRIIRTRWSGKLGTQFAATLKVVGRDDIGIVASITSVINKSGDSQLRGISIQSQGGMFEGFLTVSVPSLDLLDDLIKKILNVKGVKHVERL